MDHCIAQMPAGTSSEVSEERQAGSNPSVKKGKASHLIIDKPENSDAYTWKLHAYGLALPCRGWYLSGNASKTSPLGSSSRQVRLQGLIVVLGLDDRAPSQHTKAPEPAGQVCYQHELHVSAVIEELKSAWGITIIVSPDPDNDAQFLHAMVSRSAT